MAAIITPRGLSSKASANLPCDNKSTERVLPQEGQAIPVAFLNIQGVKSLSGIPRYKNHDTQP